ncbi:hypothetical protein HanRHA438_Chr06g0264591 [Helianthus annuus]|nr:hypothetical protein HanRHA438_Chr06g0264591 [Helianthus annuus]
MDGTLVISGVIWLVATGEDEELEGKGFVFKIVVGVVGCVGLDRLLCDMSCEDELSWDPTLELSWDPTLELSPSDCVQS